MNYKKVSRALISVSDKTGIVAFCRELNKLGVELLSTGGTAKLLANENISVTEVSDYTGFPEMMDGRLKTLHPKIHGGILGRRGMDDKIMAANGIKPIDLVVVNLYPFEQTIANKNCELVTAIENIDIGGPTMIRAAAKNYTDVAITVDPGDYAEILAELRENNTQLCQASRFKLALKSFQHTAHYDSVIAAYLDGINHDEFPGLLNLQFQRLQTMRYGENPHQKAAFYREKNPPAGSIATARQLQGKELSYNNIADADAALECVKTFSAPACIIVKHANPCGAAIAENISKAYGLAYATDPTSAFGGIIAFNRELDESTAREILARQFVEVIIAPSVTESAKSTLMNKQNIRVLECGYWEEGQDNHPLDFKRVGGGLLVQERDLAQINPADVKIVSKRPPSEQEMADLMFAWKIVKFVKSNAIVYCKNGQTIGIGAGQMSRIYSAKIAGVKAADVGLSVYGSVMASDAFFPFRDGIDEAAAAGITAVIHPGGSLRDTEVIDAANEFDIAMLLTGIRHFRH